MTIDELKEIAARYDFVVAETEDERRNYENLGYRKVDFSLSEIIQGAFVSYNQDIDCYGILSKKNTYHYQKYLRFAA